MMQLFLWAQWKSVLVIAASRFQLRLLLIGPLQAAALIWTQLQLFAHEQIGSQSFGETLLELVLRRR